MKLLAKTLYGLENVLADELTELGAANVEPLNRAVEFTGDLRLLYKVNYSVRTALAILMPVSDFRIRSKEDLYREGSKVEWEKYMGTNDTFSIVPVVNSPHFGHTAYPGLILKDAIADYFRKKYGKRPSVNTCDPGILINLHISNDSVTISIDSSVVPLFKRGYRQEQAVAPLNEVLAAGILLMSGWKASTSMTDPMCGSGTIPIEAALISCKIPAGRFRDYFGFERWLNFDKELFETIKVECDSLEVTSPVKIFCSDISEQAVKQTRSNVKRAGLNDVIEIEMSDFMETKAKEDDGCLFLNPPYGERLFEGETDLLYNRIGSTLKHNFPGYSAWLISSNKEAIKKVGLKPKEKHTLFNGALECVFLKYEMYRGSKKLYKNSDHTE